MAITKSAKKAIRVAGRKKAFNDRRRRAMREAVKAARAASGKNAVTALAAAYKAIDKAHKRGIIKKNAAARKKAQVARALSTKQ